MSKRTIALVKRQHILQTAYRLFKREGFHATGIDRIIAEAGVAKMTMYRHFPSKDGLIVDVLNWRAERFERRLDELAGAADTPERKIEAIFNWHFGWFDSPDFHGCLFQHALAEFGQPGHPVFEAAQRQKTRLKQRMRDVLLAAATSDRAEAAATALFALIEGATFAAQMRQERLSSRNVLAAARSIVTTSLDR